MKKTEAIMEILAAYDLTQSFRDAAELTGCSHHTVARYVRARDAGQLQTTPVRRNQVIDPFRNYIEGWVDDSHGPVRADVVQDKLEALGLGYAGSQRTIRRAVAEAKAGVSGWPPAAVSAVAARAGFVVPVGLRRWAAGRRAQDVVVLRVAGLEPLSGGGAGARQNVADRYRLHRHHPPPLRRRPDVRVE